jgi:hypothetical protein
MTLNDIKCWYCKYCVSGWMGEANILGFLPKSMAFRGIFTAKWCEKGRGKSKFFRESHRFFFLIGFGEISMC